MARELVGDRLVVALLKIVNRLDGGVVEVAAQARVVLRLPLGARVVDVLNDDVDRRGVRPAGHHGVASPAQKRCHASR